MASPKSISDIKTNLLRPALTSHFEVSFGIPSFIKEPNRVNQSQMYLQCSDTSLPGSSLATFEINNDHHGVTERHAYRRIFDDRIDLTFYVDARNYLPIRIFESWMGGIVDGNNNRNQLANPTYYHTAKYPSEYRQNILIRKFERDYQSYLTYTFVSAYPISISSMPVSYDSSNLLKCTVGFTYIRYYVDEISEPQKESGNDDNFTLANPEITSILRNYNQNSTFTEGSTNGEGSVGTLRDTVTGQRMDGGSDGILRYPNGQPVYDSNGNIQPMII